MVLAFIKRQISINEARALSKGAMAHLDHIASDPLENYDRAREYCALIEGRLATMVAGDIDHSIIAAVAVRGRAVVAACERAQRIDRIAGLLENISNAEKVQARLLAGEDVYAGVAFATEWGWNDPERQAKRIAEMKEEVIAAKTGPLTWYLSEDEYVARHIAMEAKWQPEWGKKPTLERQGPRGMGLSVALVAAAEAELDGVVYPEPELPNDDGRNGSRWSAAFDQRMFIAANRGN
ncbi:MAG: hypothetical protein WAN05_00175 [Roseiarcus sp.]